jgi:hypothetical protein
MRHVFCVVVAALVLTLCPVLAQAGKAEQEIRAMEKLWNESRARADVVALGALLDERWTVTHGDGTINTKAEYLADLKSGARKFFGDVKQDDFTVRVYGTPRLRPASAIRRWRQRQAVGRRAALHAGLREARRTLGDDCLARHAAVGRPRYPAR